LAKKSVLDGPPWKVALIVAVVLIPVSILFDCLNTTAINTLTHILTALYVIIRNVEYDGIELMKGSVTYLMSLNDRISDS